MLVKQNEMGMIGTIVSQKRRQLALSEGLAKLRVRWDMVAVLFVNIVICFMEWEHDCSDVSILRVRQDSHSDIYR